MSSAETGFFYVTEKSPTKKAIAGDGKQQGGKQGLMALRKHDPIANAHVMFYEQPNAGGSSKRKPIKQSSARHMRLTGRRIHLLTQGVDKIRAKAKTL